MDKREDAVNPVFQGLQLLHILLGRQERLQPSGVLQFRVPGCWKLRQAAGNAPS